MAPPKTTIRITKKKLLEELEATVAAERGAHLSWKAAAHDLEAEVARLQQENADLLATVKSYQKGTIEQVEREKRLRGAIKVEADKHAQECSDSGSRCPCDLCEIAREGR